MIASFFSLISKMAEEGQWQAYPVILLFTVFVQISQASVEGVQVTVANSQNLTSSLPLYLQIIPFKQVLSSHANCGTYF